MLAARWVFLLLAVASIACFIAWVFTGEARYRRIGLTVLKCAVGAGLLFFAVLAVERLFFAS